jgi:diadenosine tetraphosphate (Ap4A) HIT family hydrolase
MDECNICKKISSNGIRKLYEDEQAVIALSDEPVSEGHIWIIPKKHYLIIEQIPDFEVGYLFSLANKVSISLFEALQVQGTNVFVQNGVAAGQKHNHIIINVIPRMPNDGIDLFWQPKQLTEEEMSTIELRIKEQTKTVGYFEKEKAKPINLDKKAEIISDKSSKDEDYLVKSLRRIP